MLIHHLYNKERNTCLFIVNAMEKSSFLEDEIDSQDKEREADDLVPRQRFALEENQCEQCEYRQ